MKMVEVEPTKLRGAGYPLVPLRDVVEPVRSVSALTLGSDPILYIDLGSVDASRKTVTTPSMVFAAEAPSRARQLVNSGDVLVSTVRPNLNGVAQVGGAHDGAVASTGFTVLRPEIKHLDARYLFNWVRSPRFVDNMVRRATGASYPAVSDRIVKESSIPLPPLAEQRRIADILDRADELRTKRRRSLELLDEMADAIFADTIASSLGMDHTSLGDACTRITDGTHQSPEWASSGVPFLFVSNITSGRIDYSTQKHVSEATYKDLTRRAPIEKGDILYSAVGSYGVPAMVMSDRKFVFQRHIAHIKPKRMLFDPAFLRAALASADVRRQADRVARGAAQKSVTLTDLAKFRIPLPRMAEQLRFSRALEQVDRARELDRQSLTEYDELFASIQARAFSGSL